MGILKEIVIGVAMGFFIGFALIGMLVVWG